jgi:hypothetical protein
MYVNSCLLRPESAVESFPINYLLIYVLRNKLNILIIGNDKLFLIKDIALIGLTPIILNILFIYTC